MAFAFAFGSSSNDRSFNMAAAIKEARLSFKLPRHLSGGDNVSYDGESLIFESAAVDFVISNDRVNTTMLNIKDKTAVSLNGCQMDIKTASTTVTIRFNTSTKTQQATASNSNSIHSNSISSQ